MKPPLVHQPVQPPRPSHAPGEIAADDVRHGSTTRSRPGLVGDFGPLVGESPDFDLAPALERRRH